MNEQPMHPEAAQYEELVKTMEFHESNRLAPEGKRKIALVDVDETICFYPGKRRYDLAVPNYENIAKINKLFDEGWQILYFSAKDEVKRELQPFIDNGQVALIPVAKVNFKGTNNLR